MTEEGMIAGIGPDTIETGIVTADASIIDGTVKVTQESAVDIAALSVIDHVIRKKIKK